MKRLSVLAMLFLAACSKNIDKQASSPNSSSTKLDEKQSCDFGMTSFNLSKRARVNVSDDYGISKGRKKPNTNGHGGGVTDGGGGTTDGGGSGGGTTDGGGSGGGTTDGGGGTVTPPPPSSSAGVVFLDFDGEAVSGTAWNTAGDFYVAPANLTASEASSVVQRVINDYSPFNVTVTTDESVYNAANIYSRVRVIITESWEWYGKQVGGVSYVGSFTSGSNTPSFVFSSLLSYNSKYIGEAASHEAGHSFGLRHQALYDANCTKVSDYNYGQGSGEIGWAPIMGSAYSQNLSLWHNGPNSTGCTAMQDDIATIAGIVGYRNDDYSNSFSGAASLTGSLDGIISTSNDVDFFSVSASTTNTVTVIPYNVGIYNAGANTDIVLEVYSSLGILIATIENPGTLDASITLSPGNYYVSVSTTANPFTSRYGMLGKYNISVY
jgi:hypothetical protein